MTHGLGPVKPGPRACKFQACAERKFSLSLSYHPASFAFFINFFSWTLFRWETFLRKISGVRWEQSLLVGIGTFFCSFCSLQEWIVIIQVWFQDLFILHKLADKAVLHLDKQTVKFQLTLLLYSERPCLQARSGEGFAAQHNFFSSITSFRSH